MDTVAVSEARLLSLDAAVQAGVPVLRATTAALVSLQANADMVSGGALANVILRDPLMTLRVLRFLQGHRTRSQTQDITTIAHAVMMLGQTRFFREFGDLPCVDDLLGEHAEALAAVRACMSRARLAALFARDWAAQRHDMDPEEVMVAALLHDVIELLLLLERPGELSTLAPEAHTDLRPRLFARLGLPGLIGELTDDIETLVHPRVLNVRIACALARCLDAGWEQPEFGVELERVQRLLHVSAVEVWERVRRVALQAAREWRFYGILPAAARLPLLPQAAPPQV